ncbi:MAG: hypothetical protein ACLQVL_16300, partial [Terriglobia bacterium]
QGLSLTRYTNLIPSRSRNALFLKNKRHPMATRLEQIYRERTNTKVESSKPEDGDRSYFIRQEIEKNVRL